MAKPSTPPSARASRGAAAQAAARQPAPAESAHSGSWLLRHGALLVGVLIALAGLGLACWASIGWLPPGEARAGLLEVFGSGVYLLAAAVIWVGSLLIRSELGWPAGSSSELRRAAGAVLIGIGLWGALGAVAPVVTLGGARLEMYGAGGEIGDMLDSVFGWILIAGGALAALFLLAPELARDALYEIRDAGRIAGSDLRNQGPGAVAASGRATWHGVSAVAGMIETGATRSARGLSRSVDRWADGQQGSGTGGPFAAGPRAAGGAEHRRASSAAAIGHPPVSVVAGSTQHQGDVLSRSTTLMSPAPIPTELRAGFGTSSAPAPEGPSLNPPRGLRPRAATAQSLRPQHGLAPDAVVERLRTAAAAAPAPLVEPSAPPPSAAAAVSPPVSAPAATVSRAPAQRIETSPPRTPTPPATELRPEPPIGLRPEPRLNNESPQRLASDGWRLPPVDLLDPDPAATLRSGAEEQARIIVDTLASFGVDASVPQINEGPTITQFGVEPGWEVKTRQVAVKDAQGRALRDEQGQALMREEEVSRTRVRVNRITRLADDLALALAAPSIRIEAPVPGQPVVGVEVPNAETRLVSLRGLVESAEFAAMVDRGGLPIALGRDVTGGAVIADLAKMPHVLIAGATGSGKSVCINTIISSLLMNKSPEQVRLILVDPKRVELTGYGSVPHLAFSHVVTEPDEVVSVLGVVVAEMDRRYRTLERCGARNINAYNQQPATTRPMPYWVVVLDELADMMMAAPADVERQLVRLAQLARAVGIHLVVATQRPSVDVVTGLIKANFPTRIAFATTSQTDARVIMDRAGAEKLMGRGDMLYMSSDTIKPRRVQGSYVSDEEIERLIGWWTSPAQAEAERKSLDEMLEDLSDSTPEAAETIAQRSAQSDLESLHQTLETALPDGDEADIVLDDEAEIEPAVPTDTRLTEAIQLAREYERVSATLLQRRMRIGRPRAERLIEELEQAGVVAESDGGQSRRVLAARD